MVAWYDRLKVQITCTWGVCGSPIASSMKCEAPSLISLLVASSDQQIMREGCHFLEICYRVSICQEFVTAYHLDHVPKSAYPTDLQAMLQFLMCSFVVTCLRNWASMLSRTIKIFIGCGMVANAFTWKVGRFIYANGTFNLERDTLELHIKRNQKTVQSKPCATLPDKS